MTILVLGGERIEDVREACALLAESMPRRAIRVRHVVLEGETALGGWPKGFDYVATVFPVNAVRRRWSNEFAEAKRWIKARLPESSLGLFDYQALFPFVGDPAVVAMLDDPARLRAHDDPVLRALGEGLDRPLAVSSSGLPRGEAETGVRPTEILAFAGIDPLFTERIAPDWVVLHAGNRDATDLLNRGLIRADRYPGLKDKIPVSMERATVVASWRDLGSGASATLRYAEDNAQRRLASSLAREAAASRPWLHFRVPLGDAVGTPRLADFLETYAWDGFVAPPGHHALEIARAVVAGRQMRLVVPMESRTAWSGRGESWRVEGAWAGFPTEGEPSAAVTYAPRPATVDGAAYAGPAGELLNLLARVRLRGMDAARLGGGAYGS